MTEQQDAIETLEALTQKAADGIRDAVNNADLENYKYFLNMMYHYTLTSEEKLNAAAEKSQSEDLREFFAHQAIEERGHHVLAEVDLKELGFQVSPETPAPVEEYNKFWNGISAEESTAYVGAVFIFENVARLLEKEALDIIERLGLSKTESRWLRVHLEADMEHGDEAREIAIKHANTGPMIAGATKACELWIAIFKEAFEGTASFEPIQAAA